MIELTNKTRATLTVDSVDIERGKSIEVTNDKWDELKAEKSIQNMYVNGLLTAVKLKK